MENNKEKHLGHLEKITLVTEVPIKLNLVEIETKKISLYIGPNSSGKSLIMKFNWLGATYINMLLIKNEITKFATIENKLLLEYLFKHTFVDNNFTGFARFFYTNNRLEFTFNNGKINDLNLVGSIDLIPSSTINFLSKETRTFDSIIRYIKMKKLLGLPNHLINITDEASLNSLLELYRIYDIMYIENFIFKIKDGLKIDSNIINLSILKIQLYEIVVDFEKSNILYKKEEKSEYVSICTLNAGDQSILTMLIGIM